MNRYLAVLAGTGLTFLATMFGSAVVFFFRKEAGNKIRQLFLGFASGIMIAASIWSLILPSLELVENYGVWKWVPAAVGFLAGGFLLWALDRMLPHEHFEPGSREGVESRLGRSALLVIAVTLHNIPEGMAVGLSLAIAAESGEHSELLAGMILAVGVALQNIPEGAAVSLPLRQEGMSAKRAFLYGTASGIVEPVAGMLTAVLLWVIHPMLPWFLSFAAGAMIFVVAEELIPEAHQTMGKSSHLATWGVMIGFTLMMILDVALG